MLVPFEIVVGTYEEFLLGYKLKYAKNGKGYMLSQSFATHSHRASVRTVSSAGRFLASGGADDKICIFDMRSRKEIQVFMHHDGTVNTLAFTPEGTHIISGGADGVMCAMRTGNWQMEKLWGKAHKGSAVNNIAVHPTGKLVLSLGSDNVLQTWNLVKGRKAYALNLARRGPNGKLAQSIHWSITGDYFAISGAKVVEIWNVSTADVVKSLDCSEKAVSIAWVSDTILIIGQEDGKLSVINTETDEEKIIQAHEKRIKCLAFSNDYVVSACSSGIIKLWSISDKKNLEEVSSVKTGCRITCITLVLDDEVKLEKIEEPLKNTEQNNINNSDSNEDSDNEVKVQVTSIPKRKKEVVLIEVEENDAPLKDISRNKFKKSNTSNSTPSKTGKQHNFTVESVAIPESPGYCMISNPEANDDNSTSFKIKSKKCKKIKKEINEEEMLHDNESTNITHKKEKNRNGKRAAEEEIILHRTNKKSKKSKVSDLEEVKLRENIKETSSKKRKSLENITMKKIKHETSTNSPVISTIKKKKKSKKQKDSAV